MGVSNGQSADETNFNAAFMARNNDTDTIGVVGLKNIGSSQVLDAQKQINALLSFLGQSGGGAANELPSWLSSVIGASTDPVKSRVDTISAAFTGSAATGHTHDGTDGEGAPIAAAGLVGAVGSHASPTSVDHTGLTITPTRFITAAFVKGSGGAVTVDSGSQVSGLGALQILILIGCDDTNTLTFPKDSSFVTNGDRTLADGTVLALLKIGTVLYELFYNGIGGL